MFRISITDKLTHIISKLQCLLSSSWRVNAVPLPTSIKLTDASPTMVDSKVTDKLSARYRPQELTFALTFKMEDSNTVSLVGISERNWMHPALSFDQALSSGMTFKSFQLVMATTNSVGAMPGRLSSVIETVQISINCLQQHLIIRGEANWCNYLTTLPPRYYEYKNEFNLPDWFSDRCVNEIIKEIIGRRKLVSIAQPEPPNEKPEDKDKQENKSKQEDKTKQEKPTRKLPYIECRTDAGHLKNVFNITTHVENMTLRENEQADYDIERRNDFQAEEARAMRQSTGFLGARRKTYGEELKSNLLDSSIPSLPSQELLLARQVTPPRPSAPFPSQPYPWLHSPENPGWKNQQQAHVDWHHFVQLEQQMKERAEQQMKERAEQQMKEKAEQQMKERAEQQMKEKTRFAEFQENIDKVIERKGRQENLYEEIAEKESDVKPLYQITIPHKYRQVFEKAPLSSSPVKPLSVDISIPPPNMISSLKIGGS